MRTRWLWIAIPAAAVLAVAFLAGAISFIIAGDGSGLFGGKVGVVNVRGTIISADETVRDLEDMRKDDGVDAVVVRIESPGGSVGASQEMLEAVALLAKEKPVVASLGSVAASGGYYVACGATKIMANPGTVTGSIGVRMEHVAIGDLLKLARIELSTLKSGRYKDIGAIERPMTEEEKALLQEVLDELREQFKKTIAGSRNLPVEKVDELADGRVFTGSRAVELGLVDGIGGFAEAIKAAAELGGIEGEPQLVYPRKRGGLIKRMMEGATDAADMLASSVAGYWRPAMKL